MGFNAGGTNVGGVQSAEQGVLSIEKITASDFTLNTTINMEHTVPSGKKWILKSFASVPDSSGITATVTFIAWYVLVDGVRTKLIDNDTAFNKIHPQSVELSLSEGDSVRCSYKISAYTSGDFDFDIIVQEVDA